MVSYKCLVVTYDLTTAPLRDIKLRNLSEFVFNLSRSLKAKLKLPALDTISPAGL